MKRFKKILFNKYFLTAVAFALLMLFFGQNNLFVQHQRKTKIEKLNQDIHFMKKASKKMDAKLKKIKTDTGFLERYAREKYHEKKENEDIYLIVPDTEGKK